MKLSGYKFSPTWLATLLMLIGLGIFLYLGFWQVNRAEQKQELQVTIEQRGQEAPLLLDASSLDVEAVRYRQLEVSGRFEPEHEILLDNRIHNGQAGYHVITPFHITGTDSRVLVNRGWVSVGASRAQLPDIITPDDLRTIQGMLDMPKSKPVISDENFGIKTKPGKVWPYLDMAIFKQHAGYEVAPFLVLQAPDESDGYVRDWPRFDAKVGMHVGYAIQWFIFALIILFTYLGINIKKINSNDHSEQGK